MSDGKCMTHPSPKQVIGELVSQCSHIVLSFSFPSICNVKQACLPGGGGGQRVKMSSIFYGNFRVAMVWPVHLLEVSIGHAQLGCGRHPPT